MTLFQKHRLFYYQFTHQIICAKINLLHRIILSSKTKKKFLCAPSGLFSTRRRSFVIEARLFIGDKSYGSLRADTFIPVSFHFVGGGEEGGDGGEVFAFFNRFLLRDLSTRRWCFIARIPVWKKVLTGRNTTVICAMQATRCYT